MKVLPYRAQYARGKRPIIFFYQINTYQRLLETGLKQVAEEGIKRHAI